MPRWTRFAESKKPPLWAGILTSAVLIAGMAFLRLGVAGHFPLPIGYGVPIVVMALFRNRRLLWLTTFGFIVLSIVKFFIMLPEVPHTVHVSGLVYNWMEGAMVVVDLLLVSALIDLWIVTREGLEIRNTELESANVSLAAREEEIAGQNEELQSQTEELERQSEELRAANEELEHREQKLEVLLSLSRSLNTDLPRDEILSRICRTLGLLIGGHAVAAAILERKGDEMTVRCHHGFGAEGISDHPIPSDRSFASLILSRGRTGYIEDISARPDLRIPEPKVGDRFIAILATPLCVAGHPVGSLEVYSRQKTVWNQEQVALIESLAAQTSVSLEAAQLFETISSERNRFEAVLQTAPVGIAVCNAQCTQIRMNPAGTALMNVPADLHIGPNPVQLQWQLFRDGKPIDPEDFAILRAAREGEETQAEEVEGISAGGRRVFCLNYAKPIRDAQGVIQGAVSIFVDITAQKDLQRELDTRRREAEEASIRKTRFLAAVSHDIRTPANAISLLAELVRRTAGNAALVGEVPDLAQELHSSAVSLVSLLSDVLDIARFDSDKVELQESEFLLSTLLSDEQKQLLPLARQKGLSLEVNVPRDNIVVRTDRIKLARILGNLIGNAIKFTESGGVRIEAHKNGTGTVQISVSDTGVGIAPEHISHIFDEFFQLRNPERDRAKGSGLGLTICKRLVDAMGGEMSVQSTPGRGSTFTLTLPAFATVPQPVGKPTN